MGNKSQLSFSGKLDLIKLTNELKKRYPTTIFQEDDIVKIVCKADIPIEEIPKVSEFKTFYEWLDSNVKGLKKDFDRNIHMFSYNDILELKEEYIKWIKEFQKERTDAISEMFDNANKYGIYPTTKFFNRIDNFWKDKFNILEEDLK